MQSNFLPVANFSPVANATNSSSSSSSSNSISIDASLGMGAYSTVYHCTYTTSKAKIDAAAKVFVGSNSVTDVQLKRSIEAEIGAYNAIAEIRILNNSNSHAKYLLNCFEMTTVEINTQNYSTLILEYADKGSLDQWVANKDQSYSFNTLYEILCHVARAMTCLHDEVGYLHRDIKPDNVMLRSEGNSIVAKLADFGLSANKGTQGRMGSPLYSAPELWKSKSAIHTEKTDMYAFGILIYEVVTGKDFLPQFSEAALLSRHILAGKRDNIPTTVQPKLSGLIHCLWQEQPDKRFNASIAAQYLSESIDNVPQALKPYVPTL